VDELHIILIVVCILANLNNYPIGSCSRFAREVWEVERGRWRGGKQGVQYGIIGKNIVRNERSLPVGNEVLFYVLSRALYPLPYFRSLQVIG
jgi:hypothetical protein